MEGFQIAFWHWWVAALVLALVEMFVPGAAFIWLGVAAAGTGFALLLVPDMGWQWQFGFFAVSAIAFVAIARLIPKRPPAETDQPHLNRRAEQYTGKVAVLESPIVNGRGRAVLGDSLWSVSGPDLPAGANVRIVGADGPLLKVEPADLMPRAG